ncbi:hypothetical protein CHLRE_10g426600v5 [Chlamydomonas reinhardtii]|uniref:Uncharacterized protein n=1 Tax=Chlamydomonas reinhardtii TaxID=3055 RepID=A8IC26_CHLRE|nr:uncharacterized protein CHLRE_10g426600v5 [Chlamydomonas reinhardtii]PNW77203.1 hypothetical protein CHLRE_10g426600v5 [Chlamydomonas reinhardtii]|eukprot:XP_001702557.1 cytochrome P450, CYP85 clan [Chlamydomonas reinhardtii]
MDLTKIHEDPIGLLLAMIAGALVAFFLLARKEKRPLGPMFTLPILGDTVALALSEQSRFMFSRYKKYGSVFRLNLLGKHMYILSDLEALRGPYRDEGAIPEVPFPTFKLLMGDFNVAGGGKHIHGPWRKASLAALGPAGLQSMFPPVLRVMQSHLSEWEAAGRVEVFQSARRMGLELAVDVVADVELSPAVDRAWFKQQAETWLYGMWGLPVPLPGSALAKALAARKVLLRVLGQELAADHEDYKSRWTELGSSGAAMADDLVAKASAAPGAEGAKGLGAPRLSHVIRLGLFGLGATEVEHSALAVLHAVMASADTTRFALFNTWALVAQSARVQEKLYEEQQKVIEEFGPELSYKAASSMPYMDATIKECMRLLPASAGGPRKLTQDLKVGEVVLPAGSFVWMYSYLLHCLDPVLWDGDTSVDVPAHMDWRNNFEGAFRPERWLSEETKPKYYFTFGYGNHLCAGINLAYLEIRTMLALVIRKYRLRLQTPDMLSRARYFPFVEPSPGTDTVLLEAR